ncbi:unnamed protein product [Schistosoma curassoni]|uniref:Tetraspanin n=1 Tax=Schistosoma curassoni TaxID=6186 RepID=A0A183K7U7_9TREM|nr:unnamed protein product [Schistosoma curassoni]
MIKKMYGDEVAQDFTDMASGILQLTSNVYTLCFIFSFFGFLLFDCFINENLSFMMFPFFFQTFPGPFGFILFILGLVSLAICLFGFCGACCKSILCLRVMMVGDSRQETLDPGFVLLGTRQQGVFVILRELVLPGGFDLVSPSFTIRDITTELSGPRPTSLHWIFKLARKIAHNSLRNYHSIGSNNTDSIIYSVIMPTLNCCGLLNGSDFDDSPNFQRKVLFNEQNFDLKYPIPCCKMDAKFVVLDPTCPGEFNIKNSNIHEGCWVKLRQIIGFYGGMIVICGLVVILFQVKLFHYKMVVGGSQLETLGLSFVLTDTRQQGSPVILKELTLPNGFDPVSPKFTVRDG